MSVTLDKCEFGCKNKQPGEFDGGHTTFGDPICDWCAGMFIHDDDCCRGPKVSLVKASDKSPYGGNPGSSYRKTPGGRVSEQELLFRRYGNGARVSREWAYYLRSNDLRELWEFYRHG